MNKYKLAIVYHGVKKSWREDIEEFVADMWAKHIREISNTVLDITAIDADTGTQVKLKPFKTGQGGRVAYGTENGKAITRQAIPLKDLYDLGQYHTVLFAYDAEKSDLWDELYDSRGRQKKDAYLTSWSYWNELYLDTEFTELEVNNRPSEGKKKAMHSALHELMHALVKRAHRNGRNQIIDHMDKTTVKSKEVEYYKNDTPFAKDGNYERTINSITEHDGWSVICENTRTENVIAQYEKNLAAQNPAPKPTNFPERIFVHHTGGTDKNPLEDTSHHTAAIIKDWHVNGLGWDDIGYHWVIEKDGKRVQGRPETMHAAAARGWNTKAVHICLAGNFDATLPTQAQTDELKKLLREIVDRYDAISENDIDPHRTVANKTCYGRKLSDDWARNLLKPQAVEPERPLKDFETVVLIDELKYRIKNQLL